MIYSSLVKYSNVCYIGEGSQATVFSAVHEKTNKQVAIKRYTTNSISSLREIRILKRIQNLKLKHSLDYVESFIENDKLYIVTEYISGAELHDFVTTDAFSTISAVRSISKKILKAVQELHENNICHLDLKLENIMVDTKNEEVKLIDFGFSEIVKDEKSDEDRLITKFCGSVHYSAPEIVRNIPFNGKKADIWSLGILFYVLVAQEFPFAVDDTNEFALKILRNKLTYSSKFKDPLLVNLIEQMTQFDPDRRPSIKYLLQHPFFLF